MIIQIITFICPCKNKKNHRLTLDGGSTGKYCIELCKNWYKNGENLMIGCNEWQ